MTDDEVEELVRLWVERILGTFGKVETELINCISAKNRCSLFAAIVLACINCDQVHLTPEDYFEFVRGVRPIAEFCMNERSPHEVEPKVRRGWREESVEPAEQAQPAEPASDGSLRPTKCFINHAHPP
jgi:hypothetical protein